MSFGLTASAPRPWRTCRSSFRNGDGAMCSKSVCRGYEVPNIAGRELRSRTLRRGSGHLVPICVIAGLVIVGEAVATVPNLAIGSSASRSDRAQSVGIMHEGSGRVFDCDFMIEVRVVGAVHLTHAAGADRSADFIGPRRVRAVRVTSSGCDYRRCRGREDKCPIWNKPRWPS